jgi:hypothetical protein
MTKPHGLLGFTGAMSALQLPTPIQRGRPGILGNAEHDQTIEVEAKSGVK